MNKAELIAAVAEKTGMKKKDADIAVEAMLESIQESLVKGEAVKIIGFGSFDVKDRKSRTGRNPRNPEEEFVVPATRVPVWKAGKGLGQSQSK